MMNKTLSRWVAGIGLATAATLLVSCGDNDGDSTASDSSSSATSSEAEGDAGSSEGSSIAPDIENPNADNLDVAKEEAKKYAEETKSSKQWTIDHMASPQGKNFNKDVAQKAVDSLDIDWQKNANETAKFYHEGLMMEPSAIEEVLVNNALFSTTEAVKAIKTLK